MTTLPRKVIYVDQITTWWPDSTVNIREICDAGYNVIILAFYLLDSATDVVFAWQTSIEQQRKDTLDYIHSKGAILLMSAGGDSIAPYEQITGTEYGTRTANYAKQYGFDGVDYDLENFGAGLTYGSLNSQQIIDWLSDCTTACKNILGDTGIISYAPQSPYFGPINSSIPTWVGPLGGFVGVNARVGDKIDFYNVQFYNQGADMYVNYQNLFINSGTSLPFTSVKEINLAGIPLNKIVVGKPMLVSDASNGYVNPSQLGLWFNQAKQELNWNAGLMFWQFHDYETCKQSLDQVYPQTAIKNSKDTILLKCKLRKSGRLLCKLVKN